MVLKRQELNNFEDVFLILKKEVDLISEKIYRFYIFNVKHFILHPRFVTYDRNKDGTAIEIGKGAYGTVYKGVLSIKDTPNIPVAIKELNILDINDKNPSNKLSVQDLISEEDALIDLSCQQIVKYYGCYFKKVGKKVTTLNLVMRLADTSLDSIINKNEQSPYDNKTVLKLSLDIAKGMKFIHEKNWIHRDLKPANILILNGDALITDLGLCKPVESLTGTICGTPLYMAPEIHTGQYRNKVDQWSYGLIIFELMNRGLSDNSIKEVITRESLKKGISVNIPEKWDPNFSLVIKSCLKIDPKERPSFSQIIELLEKVNY